MAAATGVRPTATRTALRHRLAERGIDRNLLLLLPAVVFVIALFVYPFLYGLQLSFQPQPGMDAAKAYGTSPVANYRLFFADPYLRDTIWTTLKLGLPAALFNMLASVPIAYRMRGRVRGKRTITTILVVPITLGTVLTAEGLLAFLGPTGWFNKVLLSLHLVHDPVRLVHNYWGVLFSLIISGFPFAFLLTLAYLSGIDPSLEQAAATLGADWWRRFRHITLPLLAPGLCITFALTFVLAFSVFPSAIMVGEPSRQTRVISIAAFHAQFEQYDYAMGSAIAMIMGAVMLIIIALVFALRARFYRGATGGKG
jgi:putative spermidine/putrescine transport system permease protein